jgi:hypothetical protein
MTKKYYVKTPPCNGTPTVASFTISGYTNTGLYFSTCPDEYVHLNPQFTSAPCTVLEGQWQVTNCTLISSSNRSIYIKAPSGTRATYSVQYRYRNACGWSAWERVSLSNRDCDAGEEPCRAIGNVFRISPNPANDVIHIEIGKDVLSENTANQKLTASATYAVFLYNLQGVLVRRASSNGEKIDLFVSDIPSGLYILHIIDNKGQKTGEEKVSIQH